MARVGLAIQTHSWRERNCIASLWFFLTLKTCLWTGYLSPLPCWNRLGPGAYVNFFVCGVNLLCFSFVFCFTYFILSQQLLLINLLLFVSYSLGAHLFCLLVTCFYW